MATVVVVVAVADADADGQGAALALALAAGAGALALAAATAAGAGALALAAVAGALAAAEAEAEAHVPRADCATVVAVPPLVITRTTPIVRPSAAGMARGTAYRDARLLRRRGAGRCSLSISIHLHVEDPCDALGASPYDLHFRRYRRILKICSM
jgi:hypothetical protein